MHRSGSSAAIWGVASVLVCAAGTGRRGRRLSPRRSSTATTSMAGRSPAARPWSKTDCWCSRRATVGAHQRAARRLRARTRLAGPTRERLRLGHLHPRRLPGRGQALAQPLSDQPARRGRRQPAGHLAGAEQAGWPSRASGTISRSRSSATRPSWRSTASRPGRPPACKTPTATSACRSEVDGGGQFEFSNIELTDLDYQPLFNGRDLAGWTGDTTGYKVEDGTIVSPAQRRRAAVHGRRVRRLFVPLRFQADTRRQQRRGHSRAARPATRPTSAWRSRCSTTRSDNTQRSSPGRRTARSMASCRPRRGHLKPVGEWNHEEIIARGRHVTVIFNGVTIVDADIDEATQGRHARRQAAPGLEPHARAHRLPGPRREDRVQESADQGLWPKK